MKKSALFCFCLLTLFSLVSCGGSSQPPQIINAPPPLNAMVDLFGTSAIALTNVLYLAGGIQTDPAGHMTATLGASTDTRISSCIPVGSSATFTGTRDSSGGWTITGTPIAGQVISITAVAGSNGALSNASYTITGGCLNGDHGRITMFNLLSGTFTGSFFAGGAPVAATLTFGAPGLPQANSNIPLTLTSAFTNTAGCGGFTSATVQAANQSGEAAGVTLLTNTGYTLDFQGTTNDGSAVMFSGGFTVSGTGPCAGAHGGFTFNKQ